MFQVFDNNKPADTTGFPSLTKGNGWDNSVFPTYEEARKYAWMWLGPYGGSYDGESGYDLKVNTPWDYSGYGDMIEIRQR